MKKYLHHKYHHHHLFGVFLLVALVSLSLLSTQIKQPEKHEFLTFGVTGLITAGEEAIRIKDIQHREPKNIPDLIRFIKSEPSTQYISVTYFVRSAVQAVETKKQEFVGEPFLVTESPIQEPAPTPQYLTEEDYEPETIHARPSYAERVGPGSACSSAEYEAAATKVPQVVKAAAKQLIDPRIMCSQGFDPQSHLAQVCNQLPRTECGIIHVECKKESDKAVADLNKMAPEICRRHQALQQAQEVMQLRSCPKVEGVTRQCLDNNILKLCTNGVFNQVNCKSYGPNHQCIEGYCKEPSAFSGIAPAPTQTRPADCPSSVSLSVSGTHLMITAADGKLTGRRIVWKDSSGQDISPNFIATVNVNGFDDRHFSINNPNKDVVIQVPECGLVASYRTSSASQYTDTLPIIGGNN